MTSPLVLQAFQFGKQRIELYVPDPVHVQQKFLQQIKEAPSIASPYWSQVWPAALSLSQFLVDHSHLVQNKKVLELAAGLGLPSLVAAAYANNVYCTDYLPEAIEVINRTIAYNQFNNVGTGLLNWNELPENITADVLLLSDINYEPASFDVLFSVLQRFVNQGTTIILSTPQRIMAKPFVGRLLPWCIQQEEITVQENIRTTVMVFRGQ